ncbi:aspartate/glutamate racemase family protein [Pusillimonas sp. NJUB218]|uniref:aspartate/glutamate racemase family protein n=1 Tax=Pusillimonas sp. NJUB218 TaxID=2023230 RepID=UPI000F4B983C|nr:aspartate/glutamate racemase family protein [Pusillimonas sp. NJUB218]ROT46583.1 arylsulfatase [Pusillimonas sp. NJUB218]
MTRIALIHALSHSVSPVNVAFEYAWPEATIMNLLDDSLSSDLARNNGIADPAMHKRFLTLGDYAVSTGADAILFTCSAFGTCIEGVVKQHPTIPVLKPNEAMIAQAAAHYRKVGLLASFGPTLQSMPAEFPKHIDLVPGLAEGALDALNRGDVKTHDAAAVTAAKKLAAEGCEAIALAQFSLARSAPAIAAATDLPVLTTIDSAIAELKRRLSHRAE